MVPQPILILLFTPHEFGVEMRHGVGRLIIIINRGSQKVTRLREADGQLSSSVRLVNMTLAGFLALSSVDLENVEIA